MATYDRDEFMQVPYTQKCKFCGKDGLEWYRNPVTLRWELYGYGQREKHECRPTRRAVDLALPSEDVTELHK